MKQLIYIAEDEKNIRETLRSFLENDGYEVCAFETGDALLGAFFKRRSDLVILDIMMPKMNGLEVLLSLRKKGCRILAMNYRTRLGELDVIAADRRYVIFAEVKLRKNAAFAEAREFVTFAKRQKLAAAAEDWLQKNPQKLQPRFDVIEIYAPDGVDTKKPDIRHWENAFTLD